MKAIVLDASVFVKIFVQGEPDADRATALLEKIIDEDIEVFLPRLFYYEVFGVAARCGVPLKDVWDVLQDYEATCFRYVAETEELTLKAMEICTHGNRKSGYPAFYDACYHALATESDALFITADRRHIEKTKSLGHAALLSDLQL